MPERPDLKIIAIDTIDTYDETLKGEKTADKLLAVAMRHGKGNSNIGGLYEFFHAGESWSFSTRFDPDSQKAFIDLGRVGHDSLIVCHTGEDEKKPDIYDFDGNLIRGEKLQNIDILIDFLKDYYINGFPITQI